MASFIQRTIPGNRLRRLDFLVGESTGLETMYPPGQPPVQFQAFVSGSREECERFLKVDFFADIPGIGIESFRALITYSDEKECYRMWAFSSSQEEPMHMVGDFKGDALIFVSDPWPMPWGLQRVRNTFTPQNDGSVQFLSELWEPDGYAKYSTVTFSPQFLD